MSSPSYAIYHNIGPQGFGSGSKLGNGFFKRAVAPLQHLARRACLGDTIRELAIFSIFQGIAASELLVRRALTDWLRSGLTRRFGRSGR
jgi:hypothetical protein